MPRRMISDPFGSIPVTSATVAEVEPAAPRKPPSRRLRSGAALPPELSPQDRDLLMQAVAEGRFAYLCHLLT